jgi:hypothetical protein
LTNSQKKVFCGLTLNFMIMKNKFLIFSTTFALLSAFAFNVYAIGCPSGCRTETGTPKNAYCVDNDGPDGGKKCVAEGTGVFQCNGTWTPASCNDQ